MNAEKVAAHFAFALVTTLAGLTFAQVHDALLPSLYAACLAGALAGVIEWKAETDGTLGAMAMIASPLLSWTASR